jgi:AmmeMemoRadiSam system protein B
MHTVRPTAVAGRFYPANAAQLQRDVSAMLRAAARPDAVPAAPPKMLVVPHAGYMYSGPVAARAFARLVGLRGRVRRVVLLGPTHRAACAGLAVPSVDAFDSPLGTVPVDRTALSVLRDLPQVVESDHVHALEHALEVQLPFLQTALDSFRIVPLAVGDATADEVGEVLERLWGGPETLFVISSDLSHFLPYEQARALDAESARRIVGFQPTLDHERACGATALNGALRVARRHGLRAQLLDLRNSGDTAGDRRRVVGYCAVAFDATADDGPDRHHDAARQASSDARH